MGERSGDDQVEVRDFDGDALLTDSASVGGCSGEPYDDVWDAVGEYAITAGAADGAERERTVTLSSDDDAVWATVVADGSIEYDHIEA